MGSNTVDIKVVLIGAQYAGKTSIIHRFIHNRFLSDVPYEAVCDLVIIKFVVFYYTLNIVVYLILLRFC